jgi:hypothetical protein
LKIIKSVWIYSITFYIVDDEYGHKDWCGTYTEVFSSKESAERFKKDWEEPKNLESLSNTWFEGVNLYNWYLKYNSYESNIREKEILEY